MSFALPRALRAEALKLRRTRAAWLALGAPVAVVALYVLLVVSGGADPASIGWSRTVATMLVLWSMLMLPLYAALLAALINGVDHRAHGWKHLFVLPLPRWSVHAAKLGAVFALAALSSLVLAAGLPAAVAALAAVGYGPPREALPYRLAFEGAARAYAGALFVLSLHHALSQRVRGFEWPLGIGIVATVFATQVAQSPDWWPFLPWGYATVAVAVNDPAAQRWAMLLSAAGAVVVALLAAGDVQRRDVS